jgi:hypothetical protein
MTAAVMGAGRRVARTDTIRRLATPGLAAVVVGVVRVGLAAVLVALAMASLATTGAFLAGPIPEVDPQPGF